MFLFSLLYHLMLSGNFYGLKIWHGIFLGLNFGPGIVLDFDFCPHSNNPVTWNLDMVFEATGLEFGLKEKIAIIWVF